MRIIKQPETIAYSTDGKTVQTMSLANLVLSTFLVDPRFGATLSKVLQAARMAEAFQKAPEGSTIELEEADWQALAEVIETPSKPYDVRLALRFLPLLLAVTYANQAPPSSPA
jgi:hypothetical protein